MYRIELLETGVYTSNSVVLIVICTGVGNIIIITKKGGRKFLPIGANSMLHRNVFGNVTRKQETPINLKFIKFLVIKEFPKRYVRLNRVSVQHRANHMKSICYLPYVI